MKRDIRREILLFGVAFALGFTATAASAQTLKKVKDRGSLVCGVSQGLIGFSNPDEAKDYFFKSGRGLNP